MSDSLTWTDNLDLAGASRTVLAAAADGLADSADAVLAESRQLVPIDTAELHDSGYVTSDGLTAEIGYDTPYAVRQHEDLTYRHDAGRQAKYLEQPLRRARGLEPVAAAIRGATR